MIMRVGKDGLGLDKVMQGYSKAEKSFITQKNYYEKTSCETRIGGRVRNGMVWKSRVQSVTGQCSVE